MKKIIVIGDSNQSNLLSDVLQLVVGCVVITGQHEKLNKGYCSTTDWCGALFPSSSVEKKVPKICFNKGSPPFRKVQFFLTLFKRPLTPPPFYLNICPILQGVFFEHYMNII